MMENNIEKTGNWFVDQLSLYQNANNSNDAVKRNFVVRVSEFDLIMSDLRRKKTKDPLQHELLLGRRGSGKSTLLKRIQIEIEEDPSLNKSYIAINLAEEQAGIYRLSDLWFEALKEIALQTNTVVNLEAFSTFKDNQEYARYLHGEIHKILVEHQKKAVLLLDNLDRIVENFDDDGHLLRETPAWTSIFGNTTNLFMSFSEGIVWRDLLLRKYINCSISGVMPWHYLNSKIMPCTTEGRLKPSVF
jgi:NACHT domain